MSSSSFDWTLIEAYLAVRRHGSLSAAARALRLSQPTVRRQIEALEARVGAPLFTRDTGGLSPISTDADLMHLAETAEAAVLAFLRAASADAGEEAGVVRVSCPAVFGVEILPPILARLRQEKPGLAIELAVTNRVEDLLRHEADIAVRLAAPRQERIVARKVAPVVVGLFAAPGPLADGLAGMGPKELLAKAPFIWDDRRDLVPRGFAALGLATPATIALRTDDDLAQLAAIRAGVGIGVCQVPIGERLGLVRVLPKLSLAAETFVIMHEDLRHVARVRATFDALVAALV
jgi:DNA-binding transcriptional LysR family regulator